MLSLREVLAISEGAERERRDAKVGGWGTGGDAGFSWEHDRDSWGKPEGSASGVQVGGGARKLVVESCLLQDEIWHASSNAALWEVQGETLAGRFGKSLETIAVPHWVDGELSSPARELNEGLVNPITWHRASTCLTRVSCWILSLVFSSWILAKASARGTTWVVASSKQASTRFPKSCRSLWISLTAHCSIDSSFLLHKGPSSSSASSWASKSPIICSRPDSAQTLSGLARASAAAEAGRMSRLTPGMATGLNKPNSCCSLSFCLHGQKHCEFFILWANLPSEVIKTQTTNEQARNSVFCSTPYFQVPWIYLSPAPQSFNWAGQLWGTGGGQHKIGYHNNLENSPLPLTDVLLFRALSFPPWLAESKGLMWL